MRRIAHLSDVHILDPHAGTQKARYRFATKLVSLGRGMNPLSRSRRLAHALAGAKASGADHYVLSGDLTEVGEDSEFEQIATVLHEAALPADGVTLVPGNHDAYTRSDAWARAMAGPLAAFARSSASAAGKVVERGPVAFLPIDSTRFQTIAWSGGVFSGAVTQTIERRLADPCFRDQTVVLVMHHPPFYPKGAPSLMKWIDGLRGSRHVLDLLGRHPRLQLLHGHLHRVFDRMLSPRQGSAAELTDTDGSTRTRVFGAPATCDGGERGERAKPPAFRLYDVDGSSGVLATAA